MPYKFNPLTGEFDLVRSENGGGSSRDLLVDNTDFTQSDYYYYGGTDGNNVYKINRHDLSTFEVTQATGAWVDRLTLSYS